VLNEESMDTVWETIEYIGNTLIFMLAGLIIGDVLVSRRQAQSSPPAIRLLTSVCHFSHLDPNHLPPSTSLLYPSLHLPLYPSLHLPPLPLPPPSSSTPLPPRSTHTTSRARTSAGFSCSISRCC
jgi:hypothetical protein